MRAGKRSGLEQFSSVKGKIDVAREKFVEPPFKNGVALALEGFYIGIFDRLMSLKRAVKVIKKSTILEFLIWNGKCEATGSGTNCKVL